MLLSSFSEHCSFLAFFLEKVLLIGKMWLIVPDISVYLVLDTLVAHRAVLSVKEAGLRCSCIHWNSAQLNSGKKNQVRIPGHDWSNTYIML